MDTKALTQKLSRLKTATPKMVELLKDMFVPVSFRKGLILSMVGHSLPVLHFIETGQVRGFFIYHNEEYTSWLIENGFLLPTKGFFTGHPEIEYIEFLKNTTGWVLNLARAEALARKEPLMYRMLLEIYEENLYAGKHRELMLRIKRAEDRFLYLKKYNESVVNKIVNTILSSFLNIDTRYIFKLKKKYRH